VISLCATVFNEADTIGPWIEGILGQTRPPDEIVICDAGSTDGTIEVLREAAGRGQVRFEVAPGANISTGRNRAIALSRGEIVAVTDAGTVAEVDWLERLVEPLEADPEVGVAAGFYRPAGRNFFERVLAAVITPRRGDLEPDGFPPSSRSVAFRRGWWERVGGYPEWLDICEDLVFDFALEEAGARFAFAPEAIVAWYPRPDIRAFFHQYRGYARGDGHARLYPHRHALRYSGYIGGVLLARASRGSRLARVALAAGLAYHFKSSFARLFQEKPFRGPLQAAAAIALVPVIVVTGDVAKMIGYAQGTADWIRAGGNEGMRGGGKDR
jgi:cellulose synthase/poly-beta-1,6-N-acetylglucosamine synthase-like glycosyltransferase